MVVNDDLDWDSCPGEIWEQFLHQAPRVAVISQFWFVAGLRRAIVEMERTIDGKPLWPNRQSLIDHLQSINEPN